MRANAKAQILAHGLHLKQPIVHFAERFRRYKKKVEVQFAIFVKFSLI